MNKRQLLAVSRTIWLPETGALQSAANFVNDCF